MFLALVQNWFTVVALRKESVDRNNLENSRILEGCTSLSARRAWIEISSWAFKLARSAASLSARRAWIEILASGINPDQSGSRSPQGERG